MLKIFNVVFFVLFTISLRNPLALNDKYIVMYEKRDYVILKY